MSPSAPDASSEALRESQTVSIMPSSNFPDRPTFDRGMGNDEMRAAVEDGQTQGIPFHAYFVEVD
jgi:hypothetical protein